MSKISKKNRKNKTLIVLFWNFLRENTTAYNDDDRLLVFLKSNFYHLSPKIFYTAVGKYLNKDGKEMIQITRNPDGIDAMFMTVLSGTKMQKFSKEFFMYKNYMFYYHRGNIYPTIIHMKYEYIWSKINLLVRIIDPPINIKILNYDDFKLYANIDHPPLRLVYTGSAKSMLNEYSEILEFCDVDLRYSDIPEEYTIFKGSDLQVEQYIQLSVYIPPKEMCEIVMSYV
jgi:hypothetical protein